MEKPFFTLITPVYNIERLIAKTIDSAISQTFTDWEMVLIDDGSPDNAGKICDEYAEKDNRIKVIHKANEGLAEARNVGIDNARGQYFIIFEGSDLFPNENTLQTVYNDLVNHTVDVYFGRLADVDENTGKIFGTQKEYCVSGEVNGGKELFCTLFDKGDVLALSSPVNKAFKTEFVKKNDLRFCKGIYHDDDEWLPRAISLSGSAFFTDKIIYYAMAWDGSLGGAVSDKSLTKKACDKTFIAKRCIEDMNARVNENKSAFIKKFTEYYVRLYIDGVCALNTVKNKECLAAIRKSVVENKAVFSYMQNCASKRLKLLGALKRVFGLNFAIKLILKRYGK